MIDESVAGRFRLVEELERGELGVLWRAADVLLGREVAVKRIVAPPHLPSPALEQGRARLLREGRAAALLAHPNAVTVHDLFEEGGEIYVVMEFLPAPSLREVVRREGPLPAARAAGLGLQLLDALTAAHAAGIVHRDVKPANVLVLPGDRVKLADFGIASLEGEARLTGTGALMGSPAYLAPEQAKGNPCTPASDLWSLGATLYYALEGRDAFEAPAFSAVIAKILDGVPPQPLNAGPLEPLLAGLLRKDPASRPGAVEIRHALTAGAEAAPRTPARAVAVSEAPAALARDAGPQPFTAPVKRGGPVVHAVWSALWTLLVCLGVAAIAGRSDSPLAVAVLLTALGAGLARVAYLALDCAAGMFGAHVFEVGPRGIAFARGRHSAGYGWDRIVEIGVASRGLRRRRALMLRPAGGTPISPDPPRPPRLTGTPGRSPWFDRRTGWIGLCHLDEVKADPSIVEQRVRAFAGPRWRPSE